MIANFTLAVVSLLVGWAALFAARRSLGSVFYHLAALPVGVIGWTVVAALCTVFGVRPTLAWAAAGMALYVAVVLGLTLLFRARSSSQEVPLVSYLVYGGVFCLLAGALAWTGFTLAGFDSYVHYELSGWFLADTGRLSDVIMGARNALVPALHMADRLFGADWVYVLYPLFSFNTLALLVWVLWTQAFAGVQRRWRIAATVAVTVTMAVLPAWVFHTWFVHSNMVSALCTTLAVVAVMSASGHLGAGGASRREDADGSGQAGAGSPARNAAGIVAGLALAGLALARPDGLAYVFQGLVLLAVLAVDREIDRTTLGAAYAALLAPVLAVYGAVFATIGLWPVGKLTGGMAAAMLLAVIAFGVLTWFVSRDGRVNAWLRSVGVMRLVAAACVIAVVGIALAKRYQFLTTLRNMAVNLMLKGGWGLTWWILGIAVVITLVVRVRDDDARGRDLLLLAAFVFFAIAVVVHAAVHPGRIKITDSFNRVALHVVPVVFWYLAAYAGSVLSHLRGGDTAR